MADDVLDFFGGQQALEGVAHGVQQLVDDLVVADLHARAIRSLAGRGVGDAVEADDHGATGLGRG